MTEQSNDNSDYSETTLGVANDLFFVIVEEEAVTADVINQFEYVARKKYSFGLLNYAKYLLAPETLLATQEGEREENIIKAFKMLMMVHLKNGAAYDDDFEELMLALSPRLARYRSNARNKTELKAWRNPNQVGKMPRILENLIRSEASAFLKRWQKSNFAWV